MVVLNLLLVHVNVIGSYVFIFDNTPMVHKDEKTVMSKIKDSSI